MKNNTTSNLKYFLYARKSSEDEDRQIQSIDSQVDRLEELVKDKGLDVIKPYLTESKSAKLPNNRPVFEEMMKRIEQGKANGILCWHLNRLSRNPIDSARIQWLLQQGVIKIIKTTEREYMSDDNAILFSVESSMANQYSRDLSKVVKRGVDTKLKNGWLPWLAPVGYLNDRNTQGIIKDSDRFMLIRKAWDLMLTGSYSVRQILKILNKEWGFRTIKRKKQGGVPLALSHLYSVLTNPFYAGIIRCKGEEFPGKHEPMITFEEFDRVQKLLKKKGKPRSKIRDLPYRGFIRCGECGCMVTGNIIEKVIKSTGEVKKFTYYGCCRKKPDYDCSQKKALTQDQLEELIADILDGITMIPHAREKALEALKKDSAKDMAVSSQIYETQHRTLEQIQAQLFELTQMRIRKMIDDEEYLKSKQELKKEMSDLKVEVNSTEIHADKLVELTEKTFNFATYALIKWKYGDTQTKKDLVMALGQNFLLKDGKLTLELNEWFVPIRENKENGNFSEVAQKPRIRALEGANSGKNNLWLGRWDSNPRPIG